MTFLDSNILVYTVDKADPRKHELAVDILEEAISNPSAFRISTQVLSEYACVLIRKLKFTSTRVLQLMHNLEAIPVVTVDTPLVRRAVEIQHLAGIQFYDAQIVAAAERAGCGTVYSEDLNPGETYAGVRAIDPFAKEKSKTRGHAK